MALKTKSHSPLQLPHSALPWIGQLALSACIELVSSSARVTSVKFQQVTRAVTYRPIKSTLLSVVVVLPNTSCIYDRLLLWDGIKRKALAPSNPVASRVRSPEFWLENGRAHNQFPSSYIFPTVIASQESFKKKYNPSGSGIPPFQTCQIIFTISRFFQNL